MLELPTGYSFFKSRGGLTGVKDDQDQILLYGLTEETCLKAIPCLKQFGGVAGNQRAKEKYVEL